MSTRTTEQGAVEADRADEEPGEVRDPLSELEDPEEELDEPIE